MEEGMVMSCGFAGGKGCGGKGGLGSGGGKGLVSLVCGFVAGLETVGSEGL